MGIMSPPWLPPWPSSLRQAERVPPAPRVLQGGEGKAGEGKAGQGPGLSGCPSQLSSLQLPGGEQLSSAANWWEELGDGVRGACPLAADGTGLKLMGSERSPINAGVGGVSEAFLVSVLQRSARDRQSCSLVLPRLWRDLPAPQEGHFLPF